MADSRAGPGQPVVVALGSVDPALVTGVLDGHCRFVTAPGARPGRPGRTMPFS